MLITEVKPGQHVWFFRGGVSTQAPTEGVISRVVINTNGELAEMSSYPYDIVKVSDLYPTKREALQLQAIALRDSVKATQDQALKIWNEALELPATPAFTGEADLVAKAA